MRAYRRGSNQFERKWKTERLNLLILLTFIVVLLCMIVGSLIRLSMEPKPLISPLGASFDFAQGVAYAEEKIASPSAVPTLNPDIPEREQNIDLIKKIWGQDKELGLAIARCESGYRTHATHQNTNSTLDQGIFQINSVHGMPEMENAVANISYAYGIYLKQGTNPWTS